MNVVKKQLRNIKKISLEAELGQIPARIERCKKTVAEYNEKLKDWRERELNTVREKSGKVEELLAKHKASKQQAAAQKQKDAEELRRLFDRRKREIESSAKQQKEDVNATVKRQEADNAVRRRELETQMDAELKGQGVDVDRLSEIRKQLQLVNAELEYIEHHKEDYYAWQKDKKEYFDLEQSRKEERRRLQGVLEDLKRKFDLRREKKEAEFKCDAGRSYRPGQSVFEQYHLSCRYCGGRNAGEPGAAFFYPGQPEGQHRQYAAEDGGI